MSSNCRGERSSTSRLSSTWSTDSPPTDLIITGSEYDHHPLNAARGGQPPSESYSTSRAGTTAKPQISNKSKQEETISPYLLASTSPISSHISIGPAPRQSSSTIDEHEVDSMYQSLTAPPEVPSDISHSFIPNHPLSSDVGNDGFSLSTADPPMQQIPLPIDMRGHLKFYLYVPNPPSETLPWAHYTFDDSSWDESEPSDLPRYEQPLQRGVFRFMHQDFYYRNKLSRLPSALDPYLLFAAVESAPYELSKSHDNIDWDDIYKKSGFPVDVATLQTVYYEHVAPLLALWIREKEVARCTAEIERRFPDVTHDGDEEWPSSSHCSALVGALSLIAKCLDKTAYWNNFSIAHPLVSSRDGWDNWLRNVAASAVASSILFELKGKSSRMVLDIMDQLFRVSAKFSLRSNLIAKLYVDLALCSADLPTPFWMHGLKYNNYHFILVAGMVLHPYKTQPGHVVSVCWFINWAERVLGNNARWWEAHEVLHHD
ncbi:hypothetical protein DL93DRAFT_2151680 [Clavulina sp. PMI_390]|nr:hypothetical protein DL93DRAFT_2151680 [Clavulina sp. PMI_390]